jgi:hypothetical protein
MRLLCAFVFTSCFWVLPSALGAGRAAALVQITGLSPSSGPQLVLPVMMVCGVFDGKFSCKNNLGGVPHGKNAIPGVDKDTSQDSPDTATGRDWQGTMAPANTGQAPSAATPDAATACPHGMVGTPPNCRCPKSSELLGGNCVHYAASTCSNGLASDALPQACRVDEKLSCAMRQDGLKDCCCVTYDKF